MPRGFKRDERATQRLFENGLFLDDRSALVYDAYHVPHLILRGKDMERQRDRVMERDKGRCQIRGKRCQQIAHHLHHKKGGLTGRCDCSHNLEGACFGCHSQEHVQVRFGEGRKEAAEQFIQITEEKP